MKRATKRKDEERLSVGVNIRITPEDAERLDALSEEIRIATRHGIARAALRLGLQLLESDPLLILKAGGPAGNRSSRQRKR